jgi:hypothetical protein
MLANNETPLAAIGFEQIHRDGEPMAVIAVRGTFDLSPDGELTLSKRQELVLADEYEGHPHKTPLLRAGDLIPFKPFADATLLGAAYPPQTGRSSHWEAGLQVGTKAHKVRVFGERYWEPCRAGGKESWRLGEPARDEACVPLDYRLASGGQIVGHPEKSSDPFNPLGVGLLDAAHTPRGVKYPAPQVEHLYEAVSDPFARPEPAGLAPIPPWWSWRERFLGTRDENWEQNICPHHPRDFDYRFYQYAHPALILNHLHGDEEVGLVRLTEGFERVTFRLPGNALYARFSFTDGREPKARLNLDGLHLDLRQGPPWRVELTWRGWIVSCPRFWKIDLSYCRIEDAAALPGVGEYGLTEG